MASLSEKKVSKPFFQFTNSAKMSSEMASSVKLPNKPSRTKHPMKWAFIYIYCKLHFQDFSLELSPCTDMYNNIRCKVITLTATDRKQPKHSSEAD